jgi:hypothetical protein
LTRSDAELEITSPRDVVKPSDVKSRERGACGMPDGFGDILTKRELRDLVEYLASLR